VRTGYGAAPRSLNHRKVMHFWVRLDAITTISAGSCGLVVFLLKKAICLLDAVRKRMLTTLAPFGGRLVAVTQGQAHNNKQE